MQLFLTDFVHKGNEVIIENLIVLEQLKKVLRMKKGDVIAIQDKVESWKWKVESDWILTRYVVRIDDWNHQCVYGTIIETIAMPEDLWPSVTMYVAMPNKRDKAELIAQKLAELWVSSIVFWRAERSVLREMNEKKVARIHKIIQEAVEQSWGWQLPSLSFQLEQSWVEEREVVVFDIPNDSNTSPDVEVTGLQWRVGAVGPEWGLTQQDYKHFPHHVVSGLWNTILRMETAAIVGAYELKVTKLQR
jgi:RsmE family RNA methyltransferase